MEQLHNQIWKQIQVLLWIQNVIVQSTSSSSVGNSSHWVVEFLDCNILGPNTVLESIGQLENLNTNY
jgi:dTDP-D-glucose 4,6-dehydratase